MPAAIVVGAISAAASIYSAYKSSKSSSEATKAQQSSAEQALDFEKQKEITRKEEHDKAMAEYYEQYKAWESRRSALAARYGIDLPKTQMPDMPEQTKQTLTRTKYTPTAGNPNDPATDGSNTGQPSGPGTPSTPTTPEDTSMAALLNRNGLRPKGEGWDFGGVRAEA